MEMTFDYTSLEAYLSNKADSQVLEQILHSGSMLYTYDMVLDDLYESRKGGGIYT